LWQRSSLTLVTVQPIRSHDISMLTLAKFNRKTRERSILIDHVSQ